MNKLVYLKADEAFTDSLVIANGTDNQHSTITKTIKRYRKDFENFGALRFSDSVSKNPKGGRPSRIYILNEQQATLLVTYLGNSDVVRKFKVELVRQFFEMRKFIAERHTEAWIETRKQGKITRRAETDVIRDLVVYAKEQGSTHADMLYLTYSKLANSLCGIHGRDRATVRQLNNLSIFENLILEMIRSGIEAGLGYKAIYQVCKDRCIQAKQIAMIEG
jgi:phage regulator Rha-like protein